MKKFTRIATVVVSILLAGAWGCSETADTNDEPSERSEQSALPMIEMGEEGECDVDEAAHEQPSLDAWLAGADANVIGTVSDVEELEEPLLQDVGDSDTEWEYIDSDDVCSSVRTPLQLELRDVEVLHGEDRGDSETLEVRVRTQEANSLVFPGSVSDWEKVERIGLALNKVEAGKFYVEPLRMFEVFDGTIAPQIIDEDVRNHMEQDERCPVVFGWGAFFPDELEDGTVEELKDEIAETDVDIGSMTDTNKTVELLADKRSKIQETETPKRYVGYDAICFEDDGPAAGGPEDDEGA